MVLWGEDKAAFSKASLVLRTQHGGERASVFITDGHIGSYGRTWQWKIRSIVVSQFLRARIQEQLSLAAVALGLS